MRIELLDSNCLPEYAHAGDAGVDCRASKDCDWVNENGVEVCYVPLGFKVAVPRDHVLLLFSRSGHGWKENITLSNSVGVIDPNFRGEVQAKLVRVGVSLTEPKPIKQYDRVCQAILVERPKIYWESVASLDETNRGEGFGSSGIS